MSDAIDTVACDNPKVAPEPGRDLRVRDAMVTRPKSVPADGTVADLRRLFANPNVATVLLLDGAVFAGTVERDAVPDGAPDDLPARDLVARGVDTIGPDAPLTDALARLEAGGGTRLVVLDPDGRTLRGLLCLTHDRTGFCQS